MKRNRGFTLLELVVAFSLLGLMAGIIFSSFRLAVNSYTKSQNRIQEEARERVLQDFIKRQIGSLYPLRPTGSFLQQAGLNQMPQADFAMTQVPLFYGIHNSVTFITVAPLMFQENPGLAIVRYGASQDEGGRFYLGAMESPFTGLDSFNLMVQAPRGKPLPLIEDVRQLQFQYYGWDQQAQRYSWLQSWNGEEMQAVPSAIRIDYDDKHILVPINATFFGGSFLGGLQNLIQR